MNSSAYRLTGARAVAALLDLGAAFVAGGVIARRPPVLQLLQRIQAGERAAMRLQRLRAEFGRGPVELVIPGRRMIMILDHDDVGRVLQEAPTPFHPASWENARRCSGSSRKAC